MGETLFLDLRDLEPSVQMRLYSLSKREFVCVFCVFFACFILSIFIGLAGPPITHTVQKKASSDLGMHGEVLKTGPFHIESPQVSTYSQQLWLYCQLLLEKDGDDVSLSMNVNMSVITQGIEDVGGGPRPHSTSHRNITRQLECSGQVCKEVIILHLGYLTYPKYIITVSFSGLEQRSQGVSDVFFYFKTYNESFTNIEIWFRFTFLCITFFILCWFNYSLRKFYWRDWSIEQKWMIILLPLLLLYNDPVFPLTFLVKSWLPGMFDAIFQASFLSALLLFWLCIYHGIRQTNRKFLTFYGPKLVIVGLLWVSACTLSTWQRFNELRDPTYSYYLDISNFKGFKIFFFSVGGVYLLYLLYLLIRAYAELRSMPYFDIRLKFMTVLMVVVISVCVAVTVLRFGIGILEDNFVSTLSTQYSNSAEFMSFYGLLNFYLYTMTVVYSPARNAVFDSHYRDDPSFSMMNDSDEDVIYGSEEEDRQPLRSENSSNTRRGKPRTSNSQRPLMTDDDEDDTYQ